jgi:hypothetical protein
MVQSGPPTRKRNSKIAGVSEKTGYRNRKGNQTGSATGEKPDPEAKAGVEAKTSVMGVKADAGGAGRAPGGPGAAPKTGYKTAPRRAPRPEGIRGGARVPASAGVARPGSPTKAGTMPKGAG